MEALLEKHGKKSVSCVFAFVNNSKKLSHFLEIEMGFVDTLKDVSVPEKKQAKFECTITKEVSKVMWFRGVEIITPSPKYEIMDDRILTVRKAEKTNIGAYTCDCGSDKTTANLNIEARSITMMQPLKDVTVTAGETATFECELSYEGIAVEWFLGGEKMEASDRQLVVYQRVHLCSEPPVEFTKPLEDQTVEEEATAMLECEVSRENAEVRWFREGQEIRKTKKYDTIADGRKRALIIHDCSPDDAKMYTCDAKEFKTSCFLEFAKPLQDVEVREKESARFECEVSRESAKVRRENTQHFKTRKRRALIVKNCDLKDEGGYVAHIGSVKASADLCVIEKLRIITPIKDMVVKEGNEIVFNCETNTEGAKAKWLKNEETIFETSKYIMAQRDNVFSLRIKDAQKADEATYTVSLNNHRGEHAKCSASAKLIISEAPTDFTAQLKDQTITDGFRNGLEVIVPQPLTIRVPITGYPTPTAKWTFGEKELTAADERVSMVTKPTYTEMTISPSVRPDKGVYTLQLENDVSSISGDIEVNVIACPSAPKDFKVAEVTRRHVHLMWEPPEHDGGSPVTHYQIEKREVSRKTWAKVDLG
uniref:Uncharacterized protein n=1 Tax=Kryptolebias marmoratus TaxID=37003 RepID=A0A3Q3B7I5_KRYMA